MLPSSSSALATVRSMGHQSGAMRRAFIEDDPEVAAAQAELVASGVLAPLASGGDEARIWGDCDIASLAENRLGERDDPRALDATRRARWIERALTEKPWPPAARDGDRCYWLLDRGERAGTIAIAKTSLGGPFVRVSSLYVFAEHRGLGTARAVLERLRDALGARGLGVRLETSWTWQRSVRFYLGIGMWVRSWKHDLAFWWSADTQSPRIVVGAHRAHLSIRSSAEQSDVILVCAEQDGDRLRLEGPSTFAKAKTGRLLELDAMSTLGLALALEGWPLVRSPELWEECRASDLGPPEGLAYKIAIWEAWSRKHGWLVETPRIPVLEYPTWDELDARWKEAEQKLAR